MILQPISCSYQCQEQYIIYSSYSRRGPPMDTTQLPPEEPFAAAFATCYLHPALVHANYSHHSRQYFMTDVGVGLTQSAAQYPGYDQYALNDLYAIYVGRHDQDQPIVDVGVFEQVPEGWQAAEIEHCLQGQLVGQLCFKRGSREQYTKCMFSMQIYQEAEEQKMQEATQPSLTDKSQLINSYIKIQIGDFKKYVNFTKQAQLDIGALRFQPQVQCLYERSKGEVDIPNMPLMCFPQGVKIFAKESGFKFFTFILTDDHAQRYYCNSILFSERLPGQTQKELQRKFGIRSQRGLFSQKIFTLISQHSCTDQTNKCLEYLYRVYLSKPYQIFQQKINRLPESFKYNLQTHKSSFSVQDFGLCFKVNSSYPHTSTQAIYGIFKFMQVQNIVTVVENLLLERKVFFISDCQNMVGMAIEAFLSFIYPMSWIHGIITPLSSAMLEYTQAPMTITFGLSNALVDKIKPTVDGLFVFIDQNRVQLRNNPEMKLSYQLRKQLIARLKQFECYDPVDVRDYLSNPENLSLFKTQETEDPHFNAYKTRNVFFQLTVFMLRNYKEYYIVKSKKHIEENRQRVGGIKKFYDIDKLLHLYRKDPFMCAFFTTSLFSVLLEKKRQEPSNKWIRTLDRAIRKIAGYKKHYIQEESDICSDVEETQMEQRLFPSGCMGLINFANKQTPEEKSLSSSPIAKKSTSLEEKPQKQESVTPVKQHTRLSLPNNYDRRNSLNLSPTDSEKMEKSTSRASDPNMRSDSSIPSLPDNGQLVVYQFEVENQGNEPTGMSNFFCSILSYPYKKVSNSVVSRWTKQKFNKLRQWKTKTKRLQQEHEKQQQKNVEQQPKLA